MKTKEITLDEIRNAVTDMKVLIRQEYRKACDEFWTASTKDDKDEAIEAQRWMDELSAVAKECFDDEYNDSLTLCFLGRMAKDIHSEVKGGEAV